MEANPTLQWRILRPSPTKKGGNAYVWARCPLCKGEFDVRKNHVKSGRSRMCRSCSRRVTPSNQTGRIRHRTSEIVRLFEDGRLTAAEIADKVNCSREHVYAVQKKHLGRNLREWKIKVRGSKKVSLLELEEKAEVDVDDPEVSNEAQLVTKKDLFAKLKWAEIVPEWDSLNEYQKKLAEDSTWAKLNSAQKKLAISALVNWKATAAQNYINYCLDPSSLSLETKKAKVIKLMESGEPFFANEVSLNLSISLRRAQLILYNFYKEGALVRHPTGDKGDFCYRIGGKEARDQSCDFEQIKAYIENVSPYRGDILSHFNEIPQNVIDRAIKWMRKTHALGSLWCLERKQTYYKIGCETLTVGELHKELLLQQFAEHGPSTIFAVHKRVEQREATLRKAAHELLKEGKIVVVRSSSRTTVYGLAEGMEKCVEQMSN